MEWRCLWKKDYRLYACQQPRTERRQAEGIAAAKAREVKFGRPPLPIPDNFYQVHKDWRSGKISKDNRQEKGGSEVEMSAYISRTTIKCERDGQTYYPKYSEDLVYSAVMLPEGAPEWRKDLVETINAVNKRTGNTENQWEHRSFKERGLDIIPVIHLGTRACAIRNGKACASDSQCEIPCQNTKQEKSTEHWKYTDTAYAIWEQNDFAFSYVFTGNGDADLKTLIQQCKENY